MKNIIRSAILFSFLLSDYAYSRLGVSFGRAFKTNTPDWMVIGVMVIFIVLFGECIWDVTGTKNRISDLERNGPKQFRTDHLKEFLAGERKDLKWGYVRLGLSVLFLVLGIFVMVTHFSS